MFTASLSSHNKDEGYVTLKCSMQDECNLLLIRTHCPQIMATFIHKTGGQNYIIPLAHPPMHPYMFSAYNPQSTVQTLIYPSCVCVSICILKHAQSHFIYVCTCFCIHIACCRAVLTASDCVSMLVLWFSVVEWLALFIYDFAS